MSRWFEESQKSRAPAFSPARDADVLRTRTQEGPTANGARPLSRHAGLKVHLAGLGHNGARPPPTRVQVRWRPHCRPRFPSAVDLKHWAQCERRLVEVHVIGFQMGERPIRGNRSPHPPEISWPPVRFGFRRARPFGRDNTRRWPGGLGARQVPFEHDRPGRFRSRVLTASTKLSKMIAAAVELLDTSAQCR